MIIKAALLFDKSRGAWLPLPSNLKERPKIQGFTTTSLHSSEALVSSSSGETVWAGCSEYHPATLCLSCNNWLCACCLLSNLRMLEVSVTNMSVTAYSEHSQLSQLLLSGAAHVDHTLQTNANKKGQAQVFCFVSTSNIESVKLDRCFVHERLT